jgi:hypothetical protein
LGRPGGDRNELKNWPIRRKLLAMVLLPLLVVLPLLGLLLLVWGNAALDQLLVTKVRSDMAVAHGYFERMLAQVGASTGAVADSHALNLALHGGRETAEQPVARAALRALLERLRQREALDFIQLRGPDGRIVASDWAIGGAALPCSTRAGPASGERGGGRCGAAGRPVRGAARAGRRAAAADPQRRAQQPAGRGTGHGRDGQRRGAR